MCTKSKKPYTTICDKYYKKNTELSHLFTTKCIQMWLRIIFVALRAVLWHIFLLTRTFVAFILQIWYKISKVVEDPWLKRFFLLASATNNFYLSLSERQKLAFD